MCELKRAKEPRRNASPSRPAAQWLVAAAPLACLTLLSSAPLHAQSVAEAARQERARQQADGQRVAHVYTDDDLAKAKILTPEDRARYAAALRDWIAPNDWQLADLPMQRGEQPAQSLGEIAWAYRVAKMAQQLEASEAPAMPSNPALTLPSFLTAVPEPKRPVDGRAKRATQANGRMHVPEAPTMPNALAYPVFTLTSPPPPPPPVTPAAATSVTPDVGLDTNMNLGLSAARHAHRPLSEVRPTEPVRHELEPAATNFTPGREFNASSMNLALATRYTRRPLSEVHPMEPVRHESETAAVATVQPGDTLWHIAQERLGSGYRWKEIAAANPRLKKSTKILVGEQLRLPFPESFSDLRRRTHRVNSGDSLWKLARAAFGNGTAWLCLAKANPEIQNPDLLLPGQRVQIPDHCGASAEVGTNSHLATNLAVK